MLRPAMTDPILEKEKRLLSEMQAYRQILDAIADMVLVKGKGSRILWANRAFCDYYGMSNEQLRDLIDASFNEVDFTEQYVRDDAHVYDTGKVMDIPQEPVTRHDGVVQIFHTVKSPILDPEAHVLMTVGVSRNITEQNRAKEDLQVYQQHLEHIVEERTEELSRVNQNLSTILASLNEGIVALDREGRIQSINPAAEAFLAAHASDLLGRFVGDVIDFEPETPSSGELDWESLGQNSRKVEGHLHAKILNSRLVSIQALPLGSGIAKPTGTLLVIRDIALEREVAGQRLRHQKLESLGLLAGGIAHDFNNILSGILGNISIARAAEAQVAALDPLLEQAERACHRAQSLTQQLLTFAKGGAPVKKTIGVVALVREAAELALAGSNSRLKITVASDVAQVSADEGQLAQVVNNLVINAKQAMPGGGQVTIHVGNFLVKEADQCAMPSGDYVQIVIGDHGVGILPEHIERIFDPYFSTKPNGSGIGLTSVHSIIKQHEGHVVVTSKPSQGTQFYLYLPAAAAQEGTHKPSQPVLKTSPPMRILVLDDDDGVRRVMQSMLSLLGHEAAVVSTSFDAFVAVEQAYVENAPFATIFVDLTMPGDLPGGQVIERLRARDTQTRLIVMSGYSNDPIMANFQAYGLSARLQKPFTLTNLREVLE